MYYGSISSLPIKSLSPLAVLCQRYSLLHEGKNIFTHVFFSSSKRNYTFPYTFAKQEQISMSLPAEVQILPNIKSCLKYTRRVQHLYMCFCGVPNWSMRTLKLRKYDWTESRAHTH